LVYDKCIDAACYVNFTLNKYIKVKVFLSLTGLQCGVDLHVISVQPDTSWIWETKRYGISADGMCISRLV